MRVCAQALAGVGVVVRVVVVVGGSGGGGVGRLGDTLERRLADVCAFIRQMHN